ncbi:MAG: hypothetical protein Q6M54_07455 [Thermostichus sp. DRC_bins_24]
MLSSLFGYGSLSAQAQATACPHATLRLESILAVDSNRVCEAAAPWAERGFRVLVYLTDARDPTENAWFERIDRVEAEAGLRDLSQADFYDRNGLTLAASTDTTLPWGFNITYGETLYGTRLDTADREYERIKTNVRTLLRRGDPSQALVTGLRESYALAYPPPASPWLLGGVGAGTVAVIGSMIYLPKQRRRKQLQNQIQALQAPIATLLLALEQLLPGDKPEEMILYRLFLILGGDRYPYLGSQILNTLHECRRSLTQAFLVQGQLSGQTATTLSALEQQVEAWERLYVSLVGSREHLLNLTEEQLQTLLNPVQFLPSDQRQGSLSRQLEDLHQQLKGRPLRVNLLRVDPSQLDADGILGLIDHIQQDLNRLQTAPTLLPAKLAALETQLRQLQGGIPGLTGLLSQAQTLRQRGLDLDGLEVAEAGIRLVELLAQIQAWQEEGYRFSTQSADRASGAEHHLAQLEAALRSLLQLRPDQVASAIPTLQRAIDSLESHCRAHVQQHQKNQKVLTSVQSQFQALSRQRLPALERRIATAPRRKGLLFSPYEDLNRAKQLLTYVEQEGIPAIQRWNSLAEQQFEQAGQEIERVQKALRHCQETLDRLEQSLRQAEQQSYDRGGNTVVVVNSGSLGKTRSGGSWGSSGTKSHSKPSQSSGSSSSRHSSGGSSSRRSSGGSSRRR